MVEKVDEMGKYDMFVVDENGEEMSVQVKAFDCNFSLYHVGDKVCLSDKNFDVVAPEINLYILQIRKGVYVGWKLVTDEFAFSENADYGYTIYTKNYKFEDGIQPIDKYGNPLNINH